jgi:hypothetical protein
MNRWPVIIILGLGVVITACAVPTPYQPNAFLGGYEETQLGENIFQVYFIGNGFTSRARAIDFNLLRSAELALENGFTHFIIVDSSNISTKSAFTIPTTSQTTGSAYSYGGSTTFNATTTRYGGQTFLISFPQSTNTIVCFKGKPDIDGVIYDAQFLYNSISKKYE